MTTEASRTNWKGLPWPLIVLLGAVGLARPVLSIAGVYDDGGVLGKPAGPLILTAVISLIWVGAAVALRLRQPVLTLALVGVAYSVLAIILNVSLQPFLDDAELINVPGAIAMIVMNAVQGAVLGLIAWAIIRAMSGRDRTPAHPSR